MDSDCEDIWPLVKDARQERDGDRRDDLVWAIARCKRDERLAAVKQLMAGDDREGKTLAADAIAATPHFEGRDGRSWAKEQGLPSADVEPFNSADREWLVVALAQNLERSQDSDLVYSLVRAVGNQELVEATDAVIGHAKDADDDVRRVSAIALGALRDDHPPQELVQALLSLAQDPVDDVRDWALFALGQGGGMPVDLPEVRAVFVENVAHPNENVRAEAVRALAQLEDVEMLERALTSYELDLDLVEAAGRVGDQRLSEPLRRLLAEESHLESLDPETSEHVRQVLLRALDACEASGTTPCRRPA